MQWYWISSIHAAADLDRGNPAMALQKLKAAEGVELSADYPIPGATMYPVYLRGMVFLALRRPDDAVKEFEKLIEHRGLLANCPLAALAHLQMGRAYSLEGDIAKARSAYSDFFTLWKDADKATPILKEAQSEYAKLQ